MLKKSLIAILFSIILLYVLPLSTAASSPIVAPGGTVSTTDELLAALGGSEAAVLKEGKILLLSDIILAAPIVVNDGEYSLIGAGCEITADFTDLPWISLAGKDTILSLGKPDASSDSDSLMFNGKDHEYGASLIRVGEGTELNIYIGTVFQNTVSSVSGAVLTNEGTTNMYGGRIENCRSLMNGGVFFNKGQLFLASGRIQDVSAELGGAIYNEGKLDLIGTEFQHCMATKGGCIYNTSVFKLISTTIDSCSATEGGAVYNGGVATFSGGQILSSTAKNGKGGAVYNTGSMIAEGTYFDENEATTGGNVYNEGSFQFKEGQLHSGKARYGGQVYNAINAQLIVSGGTISGGKATVGGAVYNEGTACFSGGTVFFNKADVGAGVMNLGTITMTELGHIDFENAVFIPVTEDNRHAIRLEGKLTATKLATLQPGIITVNGYQTVYSVGDVLVVGEDVSEYADRFEIACGEEEYLLRANGTLGLPIPAHEQWWFYALIVLAFAGTVAVLVVIIRIIDHKKSSAL